MIYRLRFSLYKYQNISISTETNETRRREIFNCWNSLEDPGAWFHRTGLGHPIDNHTIKERLEALFAKYPSEMKLTIPPSKPADIILEFRPPVVSLSSDIVEKCPILLDCLNLEGVIIDYPYPFALDELKNWLGSEKVLKKWPRLKRIACGPVEMKFYGARYMVHDPSGLEGYQIKIFYCTNWLHHLVNVEKTKGSWHSWGDDQNVRYYLADAGRTVFFEKLPQAGTFLFRVPEAPLSIFCTQDFKNTCEAHGLEGLIFERMEVCGFDSPPLPPLVQEKPEWTGLDYNGPNPSWGRKKASD